MSGNTTAIERLLEVSNKLWDAMYESGEVPTYAERAHYYLALKDAMDENAKLRDEVERLRSVVSDGADNAREVLAENAKLREQVDYMTPLALYAASERERERMRELGIEVPS